MNSASMTGYRPMIPSGNVVPAVAGARGCLTALASGSQVEGGMAELFTARTDERIWRCHCGGNHFLSLRSDDDRFWVSFALSELVTNGFWERVAAAWHVLLHGQDDWCELLLGADDIPAFIAELQQRGRHG